MTRDEAEMLAIKAVSFQFSEDARRHIDVLVALGMLKLDEPETADQKFRKIVIDRGFHDSHPLAFLRDMDAAGLKIVEK